MPGFRHPGRHVAENYSFRKLEHTEILYLNRGHRRTIITSAFPCRRSPTRPAPWVGRTQRTMAQPSPRLSSLGWASRSPTRRAAPIHDFVKPGTGGQGAGGVAFVAVLLTAWPVADTSWPRPAVVWQPLSTGSAPRSVRRVMVRTVALSIHGITSGHAVSGARRWRRRDAARSISRAVDPAA